MAESAGSPRLVRFGVFEVDFRSVELRKHGLKIRLQEQPLQVLALLLEPPGELVSREELKQTLWPADTFVDFDHGLNTAINKLREVLKRVTGASHYWGQVLQYDNGHDPRVSSRAHLRTIQRRSRRAPSLRRARQRRRSPRSLTGAHSTGLEESRRRPRSTRAW